MNAKRNFGEGPYWEHAMSQNFPIFWEAILRYCHIQTLDYRRQLYQVATPSPGTAPSGLLTTVTYRAHTTTSSANLPAGAQETQQRIVGWSFPWGIIFRYIYCFSRFFLKNQAPISILTSQFKKMLWNQIIFMKKVLHESNLLSCILLSVDGLV